MSIGPESSPNPYQSPSVAPRSGPASLGSLAQSARQKQLNTARGILLAIGILTIVVNVAFYFMIESQVNEGINAEIRKLPPGMVADPVKLAELRTNAIRIAQLIQGAVIALGVLFVVFGLIVKKYPVPITITSLVLYIGAAAVLGLLDPATLVQGIVFKIIIIVGLAKSIQSALAYEREKAVASSAGFRSLT
jgi:hypothetical protein